MDPFAFSTILLVLIVIFLLILSWAVPVRLWVEAVFAGVRIGIIVVATARGHDHAESHNDRKPRQATLLE